MATRPKGYGLSAEVRKKIDGKYMPEKEQEVRLWMEEVMKEPLVEGADSNVPLGADEFGKALKNGIYLCRLAETIMGPGSVKKYNTSKMAFKMMENINNFLVACENYGVSKNDLFQTVDLYEAQNLWQVILTIYALGRKASSKGFDGPQLGPKESQKNVRNFTEEQLAEGKNVIGLQMGTNKLASQSGMSFGATRHIADLKVDSASRDGQSIIGLQMGTNQCASQSGMSFGQSRHIADIKVDAGTREGQGIIGLQAGSNQGATQSGQSFGKTRSIVD